jgi:hypothetical protein
MKPEFLPVNSALVMTGIRFRTNVAHQTVYSKGDIDFGLLKPTKF